MKPRQNPYPWYAVNEITRALEPYAIYAAQREMFNRMYQPELENQFLEDGELDFRELTKHFQHDEDCYGFLSGDPLMIEIVHGLMNAPEKIATLAKINAAYMNGFTKWPTMRQARLHMLTACLRLGDRHDDHNITKRWLRLKTLVLWASAWIRATRRKDGARIYCPDKKLVTEVCNQLPPLRTTSARLKWPWERVYSSLGLDGVTGAREPGRREHRTVVPVG
jgi:hypothetical protein